MFKRIEKRLKRMEREEERGLDDAWKAVFGFNDTDSDESDSESDSSSQMAQDEDDTLSEEKGRFGDDEEEEDLSDKEPERTLITVQEALNNPIYLVSLDPDIRECIACPGKLLKGAKMVETHTSSNAHERRFKQFKKLAGIADPGTSAQEVLSQAIDEKSTTSISAPQGSKRAEKRRIAIEKRKAKRDKFKARQKAKKVVALKDSPLEKSEEKVTENAENQKLVSEKGKEVEGRSREERKSLAIRGGIRARTEDIEGKTKKQPTVKETLKEDEKFSSAKESRRRKAAESQERPKKKRKTVGDSISSTTLPAQTKRPSTLTEEGSTEPLELVEELQTQVKDIIKSASSLAKAARFRALNGTGKPSSSKKKKTPRS